MYEVTTGRPASPPLAPGGIILDAAISADGRQVAAVYSLKSTNETAPATEPETRSLDEIVEAHVRDRGQPLPHPDEVIQVRFSPDGRYLLTACRDGFARVWNCGDGRLAGPPLEHRGEVYAGVFTPDGRWVLTSTGGIVWDWRTGNPVTPPLAQDFVCSNMAITPNGEYAVLTGFGAELQVLYLGDLYQRDDQDLDDLCLRAEILSDQRIHRGGGEVKLTTDEWLTRRRRFRQRYPESLPFSPEGDAP